MSKLYLASFLLLSYETYVTGAVLGQLIKTSVNAEILLSFL